MPFEHPKMSYEGYGSYALTDPSVYKGKRQTFTIPKGFRTDLATVPRIFWAFLPPQGLYEAAAVLHDWLCAQLKRYHESLLQYEQAVRFLPGSMWPKKPVLPEVNSRDTDGLFRRVMREGGVGFCTRWVMWAAVRWAALFTPHRREGWRWWRTAPGVLLVTLLVLIPLLLIGKVLW